MLVTDRLVFIHLHKSGGTFVNELFLHCVPGARRIGYHLPYRELPPEFRDLPVLGMVRNPWDYYVSWFHFQRDLKRPNALYQICSDAGRLDFDATVANLVELHDDTARLALLERFLPDTFQSAGLNLTKNCLPDLRDSGLGFYSFLHQRMYAGAERIHIVQMEHLREGIADALGDLGHMPDAKIAHFLAEAPPLNTSRHDQYQTYYTPKLRALIAARDRSIIDRYGYTF